MNNNKQFIGTSKFFVKFKVMIFKEKPIKANK